MMTWTWSIEETMAAIEAYANHGHCTTIELLLKRSDEASFVYRYAFQITCEFGFLERMKLLREMNSLNPTDFDSYAIQTPSHNGHVEVVKLLLEREEVDPTVGNNCAIY